MNNTVEYVWQRIRTKLTPFALLTFDRVPFVQDSRVTLVFDGKTLRYHPNLTQLSEEWVAFLLSCEMMCHLNGMPYYRELGSKNQKVRLNFLHRIQHHSGVLAHILMRELGYKLATHHVYVPDLGEWPTLARIFNDYDGQAPHTLQLEVDHEDERCKILRYSTLKTELYRDVQRVKNLDQGYLRFTLTNQSNRAFLIKDEQGNWTQVGRNHPVVRETVDVYNLTKFLSDEPDYLTRRRHVF